MAAICASLRFRSHHSRFNREFDDSFEFEREDAFVGHGSALNAGSLCSIARRVERRKADVRSDELSGGAGPILLGREDFSRISGYWPSPTGCHRKAVPGPGASLTQALSQRQSRW
jgi:hypothetical protein